MRKTFPLFPQFHQPAKPVDWPCKVSALMFREFFNQKDAASVVLHLGCCSFARAERCL
jgi:hypothetical protein